MTTKKTLKKGEFRAIQKTVAVLLVSSQVFVSPALSFASTAPTYNSNTGTYTPTTQYDPNASTSTVPALAGCGRDRGMK